MTRRDVLTARICAAILANPNINPLTATAADVVHQARRVLDRCVQEPEPNHAPVIVPPANGTNGTHESHETHKSHGSAFAPRNGGWLYRMAEKRGALDWFNAFGRERGYPRRIVEWSDGMVKVALDARRAQNGAAVTNGRAR